MLVCAAMLALVIDVSRSIDPDEYQLQMQGTANVFLTERLQNAIDPDRPMAVSVIIFSDRAVVSVPWTLLRTRSDSIGFSARVRAIENPQWLYTNALHGLGIALDQFESNAAPCESDIKVIDISADGLNNGAQIRPQDTIPRIVQRAQEMDIRINALPILPTEQTASPYESADQIYNYYNDNFVAPTGGFTIRAHGFEDFARAIFNKITTEIASRK